MAGRLDADAVGVAPPLVAVRLADDEDDGALSRGAVRVPGDASRRYPSRFPSRRRGYPRTGQHALGRRRKRDRATDRRENGLQEGDLTPNDWRSKLREESAEDVRGMREF